MIRNGMEAMLHVEIMGKAWYNDFQWLVYHMDSITLFGLVTLSETGHWE